MLKIFDSFVLVKIIYIIFLYSQNKLKQTKAKLETVLAEKQQRNARARAEADARDRRIKKLLNPDSD